MEQISDGERAAYHLQQLQIEMMTVIEYLEPQYSKLFFGFQKEEHRFICLHCLSVRQQDAFFDYKDYELNTAQIVNTQPSLNVVHCIFCSGDYLIKREKCKYCGNEIADADNGLCLSCTQHIPKDLKVQPSIKLVA